MCAFDGQKMLKVGRKKKRRTERKKEREKEREKERKKERKKMKKGTNSIARTGFELALLPPDVSFACLKLHNSAKKTKYKILS